MAFDRLKYRISADASEFRQELRKANTAFERFQRSNRGALRGVKSGAASAAAGIAALSAGAVALGGTMATLASQTASETLEISRLAQAAKITSEEMSGLAYGAGLFGAEAQDMVDAIATITDRAEDAKAGMQSFIDDFALVGIEVDDLRGKDPQELFYTFADAIASAEDPNKQLTAAVRILGDDVGRKLLPMLQRGRGGIEEFADEAERLGVTIDEKAVKASEDWNRATGRLEGALTGLRNDTFVPMISDLAEFANGLVENEEAMGAIRDAAGGLVISLGGLTAMIGDAVDLMTLGSEEGAKFAGVLEGMTQRLVRYGAQVRALQNRGEGYLEDLEDISKRVGEINAQLNEGNLAQAERVKLEVERNRLLAEAEKIEAKYQRQKKIEELKTESGTIDELNKRLEAQQQELLKVGAVRDEIYAKARSAGLDPEQAGSLGSQVVGGTPEQRRQAQLLVSAIQEVDQRYGEIQSKLRTINELRHESIRAENELINMGELTIEAETSDVKVSNNSLDKAGEDAGKKYSEAFLRGFEGGFSYDSGVATQVASGLAEQLAQRTRETAAQAARGRAAIEGISVPRIDDPELDARIERHRASVEESQREAAQWAQAWQNAAREVTMTIANSGIDAFFSALEGNAQDATDALKNLGKELLKLGLRAALLGALQGGGSGSGVASALGFASGGYVSGPGSSTSDSIPARLSDGEFVMRAAAVDKFGVGFMDAINNLRIPSAGSPQRFANGGLAKSEGGGVNLRVINVTSPEEALEAMATPAGEKVVWNVIERRREEFVRLLNK